MAVSNTTNFLSPIGFQFGIKKIPNVGFYSQRCNLPDLSLPEASQSTPFSDSPVPGDKMTWGSFSIDFIVDEQMENYLEVYQWMISLGFPTDYAEFTSTNKLVQMSDGVLQILGANNVVIRTLYFQDMFPVSLGAMTFSSTETDVQYIQCTAEFKYTVFKIE